jgi:hypothetical protein
MRGNEQRRRRQQVASWCAMSALRPPVTQDETIAALLGRTKRRGPKPSVPIRKTVLQQGTGRDRTPGPLADLCTNHDDRALDLYLLVVAIASSSEPYTASMPAATWARMLGLSDSANAKQAVSKTFRRLVDHKLLARDGREGRQARFALLNEAGDGTTYTRPTTAADPWLPLPYSYWSEGWHRTLSLPGKVALLIALALKDGFPLPAERGPRWYGISADTVQRGLAELVDRELLEVESQLRREPLSATGYTEERLYSLIGPFRGDQEKLVRKAARLASVTRLRTG